MTYGFIRNIGLNHCFLAAVPFNKLLSICYDSLLKEKYKRVVGFMKKTIIFITALLFCFTFAFSKDFAILVGINQYQHLPKLKYAENDAIDMTELLQDLGFQTQTLVNRAATHENILNCLDETVQKTDEDDLIMFFFSGHGFAGSDLSERGVFSVDTDMKSVFPISQEEILEILSQTNGNKVLFLDACYQGSRTKDLKRDGLKPKLNIQ